jgi:hypothetical protein
MMERRRAERGWVVAEIRSLYAVWGLGEGVREGGRVRGTGSLALVWRYFWTDSISADVTLPAE